MSRRVGVVLTVLAAIIGISLFVYADLSTKRELRLTAVVITTLALLSGMVFAGRRDGQ